jgi:intron-binding protein aquarius
MLLEFSQYLENYLWKNYEAGRVSRQHVISIAIMINEKFRERVFAWGCFKKTEQAQFADFFENILKLVLDKFESTAAKVKLSYQEQTILIKFLDNCINSLEFDMVRTQVQRICGLPMWVSLSENRREYEFKKFPKLKKFWKAIEKNDKKLSKAEQEKVVFERTFFKSLIQRFLEYLNTFDRANSEAGEVFDEKEYKFKMHYLERVLELLIDLEALLPTRRFFNTLLEDSNLLIHCYMSALHKMDSFLKIDTRLFNQLVGTLKFYTAFEISNILMMGRLVFTQNFLQFVFFCPIIL